MSTRILGGLLGDLETWQEIAKVAPLGTAVIALAAACIAWRAVHIQRDTARRRAAIDFFLKTETDKILIDLYDRFLELNPDHQAVTTQGAYEAFKARKVDYKDTRSFLNLLELIAVGVNQEAFSYLVSYDYWGDILIDGWEDCRSLVAFIRKDIGQGHPEIFQEIEKLYVRWKKDADAARQKALALAPGP